MRGAVLWVLLLGTLLVGTGCPPDPPGLTSTDDDDDDTSPATFNFPSIVVHAPQRATFHDAGSTVTVEGVCYEGDAPLDTLSISGVDVPLGSDGSFSHDLAAPLFGINVLEIELFDIDGERAVEALAFHYGPTHLPGAELHSMAVIQAAPELLDDDNPDLDDTASLVEAILEDPSTFQGLPSVEYSYLELSLDTLDVPAAAVDITPTPGVLALSVVLTDLYASFTAQGVGFWDWVEISGEAWVDEACFDMDLAVSASGGSVQVTVQYVDVSLQGMSVTVDYVPDFLEPYLTDYLQEYVEDEIRDTAEGLVADFIGQFLDSFAMDFQFSETVPVSLSLELDSIEVTSQGITLTVGGGAFGIAAFDLPNRAGSLATPGSPPSVPFSTSPLSVAVDDDFVNQLLLSLWMVRATKWTFTPEDLQTMGAEEIPPPLGPLQTVDVEIILPMVMTSTSSAEFDFNVGVGEVWSDMTRTDGEHIGFSTSILGAARVEESPDGSLNMTMQDQASEIVLGIGVLDYPDGQVPSNLAALAEMIVPPMLGQANAGIDGFFLPTVALSDLADIGFFAGKELRLADPSVGTAGGEGLWFLLEGGLEVE